MPLSSQRGVHLQTLLVIYSQIDSILMSTFYVVKSIVSFQTKDCFFSGIKSSTLDTQKIKCQLFQGVKEAPVCSFSTLFWNSSEIFIHSSVLLLPLHFDSCTMPIYRSSKMHVLRHKPVFVGVGVGIVFWVWVGSLFQVLQATMWTRASNISKQHKNLWIRM